MSTIIEQLLHTKGFPLGFIHGSTASFPTVDISTAVEYLILKGEDPFFGHVNYKKIQLCPQNCIQPFSLKTAKELRQLYSQIEFRLHANVRLSGQHNLKADLNNWENSITYFIELKKIQQELGAKVYTLHPGVKKGSLDNLFQQALNLSDFMECNVGIEGMYPLGDGVFFLDSWKEYESLLNSGCYFAINLSHINILKTKTGIMDEQLVRELIKSKYCLEIYVSSNAGLKDTHELFLKEDLVWFYNLLQEERNNNATIFYDGIISRNIY